MTGQPPSRPAPRPRAHRQPAGHSANITRRATAHAVRVHADTVWLHTPWQRIGRCTHVVHKRATHVHTQTHSLTHTHTRSHTHTHYAHTHTTANMRARSHTHTPRSATHSCAHTFTHTSTKNFTYVQTRSQTCSRMHRQVLIHTHTRPHTLALSPHTHIAPALTKT